jgi:hypothetical protein
MKRSRAGPNGTLVSATSAKQLDYDDIATANADNVTAGGGTIIDL